MNKEEYLRMYDQEKNHWWYAGMRSVSAAFLLEAVGDRSQRVLDAGCGTGAGLEFLSAYGVAYGVDLAPEAIGLCTLAGKCRLARASVDSLPFPESSFNLVTSFDVLYHRAVEDDLSALCEFHRVLKDGGILLLRVPAFNFLRGNHDLMVHTRHRYRSGELSSKLSDAGFVVDRISYANCLLFPLAMVKRMLEGKEDASSDVQPAHPVVNSLLQGLLRVEAAWLKKRSLPFGLSLFALARKPVAP